MHKILIILAITGLVGCAGAYKPRLYAPMWIEFCATKEGKANAFCKKPFLGDTRTIPREKVGNICMTTKDFIEVVKFFRKYCTERPEACKWRNKAREFELRFKGDTTCGQ